MLYNREEYRKIKDKKVMRKVKKQWVTVSVALLMAIGGGAAVKHADDDANVSASVTSSADSSNQLNHSTLSSSATQDQSTSAQAQSVSVPTKFMKLMQTNSSSSSTNSADNNSMGQPNSSQSLSASTSSSSSTTSSSSAQSDPSSNSTSVKTMLGGIKLNLKASPTTTNDSFNRANYSNLPNDVFGNDITSSASAITNNITTIDQFINTSNDVINIDPLARTLVSDNAQTLSNDTDNVLPTYTSAASNASGESPDDLVNIISDEFNMRDGVNNINGTVQSVASSAYASGSNTVASDSGEINVASVVITSYGNQIYANLVSGTSLSSAQSVIKNAVAHVRLDSSDFTVLTGNKIADASNEVISADDAENNLYNGAIATASGLWTAYSGVVYNVSNNPYVQHNATESYYVTNDEASIASDANVINTRTVGMNSASSAVQNANNAASDAQTRLSAVNQSLISSASNDVNNDVNDINRRSGTVGPNSLSIVGDSNVVASLINVDPNNSSVVNDESRIDNDGSVMHSVENAESSASASANAESEIVKLDSVNDDADNALIGASSADSYDTIANKNASIASSAARDARDAAHDAQNQLANDLGHASSVAEDTTNSVLIGSESAKSDSSQVSSENNWFNQLGSLINNLSEEDPSNEAIKNDASQVDKESQSASSDARSINSAVQFINNNYDQVSSNNDLTSSAIADSDVSGASSYAGAAESIADQLQSEYNTINSIDDQMNSMSSDALTRINDANGHSASDAVKNNPDQASAMAHSAAVKTSGSNVMVSVVVNIINGSGSSINSKINSAATVANSAAQNDKMNSLVASDASQIASNSSVIANAMNQLQSAINLANSAEATAKSDSSIASYYSSVAANDGPATNNDRGSAASAALNGSEASSIVNSIVAELKSKASVINSATSNDSSAASDATKQSASDAAKNPMSASSMASSAASAANSADQAAASAAKVANDSAINSGASKVSSDASLIASAASEASLAASAAKSDDSVASMAASEAAANSLSANNEHSAGERSAEAGNSPAASQDNSSANSYKSAASKAANAGSQAASNASSAASVASSDAGTMGSAINNLLSNASLIASESSVVASASANHVVTNDLPASAAVNEDQSMIDSDEAQLHRPHLALTDTDAVLNASMAADNASQEALIASSQSQPSSGAGNLNNNVTPSTPNNSDDDNSSINPWPNVNPIPTLEPTPVLTPTFIPTSGSSSSTLSALTPTTNRQTMPASNSPKSNDFVHHIKDVNNLNINQAGNYHGNRITRLKVPSHFRWFYIVKTCLAHRNLMSIGSRQNYGEVLRPNHEFTARIDKFFKIQRDGHTSYQYECYLDGHQYFVTGNSKYTQNAYYQPHDLHRIHGTVRYYYEARVIVPCWVHSRLSYTRTNRVKYLRRGKRFSIKKVVNIGRKGDYQTRFELTNGNIVTANKNFIQLI